MDVRVGLWRKLSTEELMLLNCGVGEDSWESLGLQRRSNQSILKEISPGISLEGMMLKLKLQYFVTSCEEMTHWKRLWCWEELGAREGDDRGWDGWMASLTRWMWVWVNSGSWWWKGGLGVLQFMGLQRVGHDWATNLIWCLILSQRSLRLSSTLFILFPLFCSLAVISTILSSSSLIRFLPQLFCCFFNFSNCALLGYF